MENDMYSIGKVEEMCKITKKALRYYDKIGILSPDKISDDSGYRYYSKRNLLLVPLIKYYKQSGFKLDEMREYLGGASYFKIENGFRKKIDELISLQSELELKLRSVNDWYKLILEAEGIMECNACQVGVKYIEKKEMIFLDQDFKYDYMDSIINIEFTNYIESKKNAITGPVIISYPSFKDKMNGNCKKMRIMQETILKCDDGIKVEYGCGTVVSCYHIGPHETINETYKKMSEWIKKHGYTCEDECYERYVTDYWTTQVPEKFVTEVIFKIKK